MKKKEIKPKDSKKGAPPAGVCCGGGGLIAGGEGSHLTNDCGDKTALCKGEDILKMKK
jgi:hypothetical protein